jgi:uncharacterized protein (DUF2062 family)
MLTNPLTFGFWLWLAYSLGNLVLGSSAPAETLVITGWSHNLQEVGGPVLLGMGIFGVGGAALGYLLVQLSWRLRVALRRRQSNTGA